MSRDRLFGKYQHNLCVHSPLQYRSNSGDTSNCEDEERFFHLIQGITKSTSNNQPGHIIGNLVVRAEVECQGKEKFEHKDRKDAIIGIISKLGKQVERKIQKDSFFSYADIEKYSADWQAHLERISDFLIFGKDEYWEMTEFGIRFFDFEEKEIAFKPKVHHFRSTDIQSIKRYLNELWVTIVRDNICIPIHQIRIGDEDESVSIRTTPFLREKIKSKTPCAPTSRKISALPENDEPDCDLENFVLQNCGSSSSSDINLANHTCNDSIGLSSNEAKAFCFVLGEVSPHLLKYDRGISICKRLTNLNNDFKNQMVDIQNMLKKDVVIKLSELKTTLENWERAYLLENEFSAPTNNDYIQDSTITTVINKIKISDLILNTSDFLVIS